MGQRPTRRGRPHCEAFPAFDIVQGEQRLRAGGGNCTWRNERGQPVGQGCLMHLDTARAIFSYEFGGSANITRTKGVMEMEVSCTRRNPHVIRKSFVCPDCSRATQKLFFAEGSWKCRSCHGLVYLTQRLGAVNKIIRYRDVLAAELNQSPSSQQRTRAYHNSQRQLSRINRELAAEGFTVLPQELLFQTQQVWEASGAMAAGSPKLGKPVQAIRNVDGGNVDGTNHVAALAIYRPPPPAPGPLYPCELIGSKILDQPWQPFFRRYQSEKADQLVADPRSRVTNGARISEAEFATSLAEQIELCPIVITSDWSEIESAVGPTGQTEYWITATYNGDPILWRAGPCIKAYKRELRAVLDTADVTLRVRSPLAGRFDPQASLDSARTELERRLTSVEQKVARLNADRTERAYRWIERNRLRITAKPAIRLAI